MEDKLLLNREEAAEWIGIKGDIADKYYLYEEGFPVVIRGKRRLYIKSQIEPWIIEHPIKN